ncbi:hypothetical protein BUGL105410_23200 [Burkholderia gladioli]
MRASDKALPGGRLKEIVTATKGPSWLIAIGVVPGPKLAIAESGIMVDFEVDTASPEEVPALPVAAIELSAALRAESVETACAVLALDLAPPAPPPPATKVPAAALVCATPLALPPVVLIHTCLSISGSCQYFGASSITTWYWFSGL